MSRFLVFFLLASALLSPASHGQTAPAPSKTQHALKSLFADSFFSASLQEGFHFNEKAPNQVRVGGSTHKHKLLQPREIRFEFPPSKTKDGVATLFVCDDAVTICERHVVTQKVTKKAQQNSSPSQKKPLSQVSAQSQPKSPHDFIASYATGLERAKQDGKLLLIDFSATWCPACVRLEKEIFSQTEFKDLTKNFVKVKLDTDIFENQVIAEKFKVAGIPTILIISADQAEIDRIVDYQPIDRFREFLAAIQQHPVPLTKLAEDPSQKQIFAERSFAAGRYKEALDALEKLQPRPTIYLSSRVYSATAAHKKGDLESAKAIAIVREVIAAEPTSTRSLHWRNELLALLGKQSPEEAEAVLKEGTQLADRLLADQKLLEDALKTDQVGEFTGYEKFYVAFLRAMLTSTLHAETQAEQEAWSQAANIAKASLITAKTPGLSIRLLSALDRAKRWTEAEKLGRELLLQNKNDADVKRRLVNILVQMGRFKEAIPIGRQALQDAFGRNEFWVVENLAKALLGAKKNQEAAQLLEKYLSRAEIDYPNLASTKKKLEGLRDKAKL